MKVDWTLTWLGRYFIFVSPVIAIKEWSQVILFGVSR